MTLDWDIMVKVHRRELTPAAGFAQQAQRLAPRPVIKLEGGIHALALVNKKIIENPIGAAIVETCANHGIRLELRECYQGYREALGSTVNVITWGMKQRHSQYVDGGRNVLFIENGLLGQRHGCYMDAGGYFSDSSIVTGHEWDMPLVDSELAHLADHTVREFGWERGVTFNPSGPIMVALQTPNDAPLQHYLPRRVPGDANQYVIDCASAYLPEGVDVILRPHPRHDFNASLHRIPDSWMVDRESNPYALLRQCRALVCANSTLSVEAIGLGIPVACLGKHVYTGSGAVLECSDKPERLRELTAWRPDANRVASLLCAVMRRQIPYRATSEDIESSQQFKKWATRCETARLHSASQESTYAAAAMRIRCRRDPILWALADTTTNELTRCKPCAKTRHWTRIADADTSANGPMPVISPAMIDRLGVSGLDVVRPDLTGYADRLCEAQNAYKNKYPLPDGRIPLGFLYAAHLGDTLCTTALAASLRQIGRDITIVRHHTTLASYANLGVEFRNESRIRLSPPGDIGNGHVIQRLQRWFGGVEETYPRPTIVLSAEETAWAAQYTAGMARPLILVSTGAVSNGGGYSALPWAGWGGALSECGTVLQCVGSAIEPRLPSAIQATGLNVRQWFALFGQAQMYFGTWAAGIHVAAAFGIEALVVTCPPIEPRTFSFPLPPAHIITFLYPQHAYGVPRK